MPDRDLQRHEFFMDIALNQAELALNKEEVPIGAVVVSPEGQVIGEGHNQRETTSDPTAHAEILALREAGKRQGDWRLQDCSVYVTVEPCPMCAGALVNSRVEQLVFGVRDPKAGAVVSLMAISSAEDLNHQIKEVIEGVRRRKCKKLLRKFFQQLRSGR